MNKTKALNIFRSFCIMISIMAVIMLIALGVANVGRLDRNIQIGIGLLVITAIGTSMIYSTIYSDAFGRSYDDDDYDDYGDDDLGSLS